eukprot:3392560-Alexandrium_andersonii.AAC.1
MRLMALRGPMLPCAPGQSSPLSSRGFPLKDSRRRRLAGGALEKPSCLGLAGYAGGARSGRPGVFLGRLQP